MPQLLLLLILLPRSVLRARLEHMLLQLVRQYASFVTLAHTLHLPPRRRVLDVKQELS